MSHQANIILLRFAAVLGLALTATGGALGAEQNGWPVRVAEQDAGGRSGSWTGAGPFLFSQPTSEGGRLSGVRPFYVKRTDPKGELLETDVLYPLFTYRTYHDTFAWSVLQLANRMGSRTGARPAPTAVPQTQDVWPLYFSSETGDPATSYRAVLPFGGTIKERLGYDRISWTLFPLYARTERHGTSTTYAPFPFLRFSHGAVEGWGLWPLLGHNDGADGLHTSFALWPLCWNNTLPPKPGDPKGTPPTRQLGVIPFYTLDRGPGLVSESYVWPFFGYTDRTQPDRYRETRYFWPFLVKGRGDEFNTDRWGPFYTHSVILGVDKTWVLWPLWKQSRWTGDGRDQSKVQVVYFFFSWLEQRKPSRPEAPPARKIQLWPLFSFRDDGGGGRQWETLSPVEPLFADNPSMRAAWSPLFALIREEELAGGRTSGSALWNAVTWRSDRTAGTREFHLGPLFSSSTGPAGRRIAFGNGLFGIERGSAGWRPFLVEFSGKAATLNATSR